MAIAVAKKIVAVLLQTIQKLIAELLIARGHIFDSGLQFLVFFHNTNILIVNINRLHIVFIPLHKFLYRAAFTLGNRVNVYRNTLNVQTSIFIIIEDVEKTVFTDVSFELQKNIEVAVIIAVTIDTGTDDLDSNNLCIDVRTF